MYKTIRIAISDFKLVFRDPSLRVFLALPIILFVMVIWAVPALVRNHAFLEPYLSFVLVFAAIENTQLFSFICSMVMIDEKETEVAKVYGIVPLTGLQFVASRFLFPYLITVALNMLLFLVQPFFLLGLGPILAISFLTGLVVPVYALAINIFAQNRLQGMVYIKGFNMIVLLPVAAFFLSERFQFLFAIFPTHWIFQSIDKLANGHSIGLTFGIGLVFFLTLLGITSNQCLKRHFI